METLIKECKPRGNSASVYVPKSWENHLVRVSLLSPRELILEVLKPHLPYVKGVYVYGSHVRGEAGEESDVDALVVVSKRIDIKLKRPLELVVATEKALRAELDRNPITLKPILNEAQVIINDELLERLKAVEVDKQRYVDFLNETIQRTKENVPLLEGEKKIRAVVYSLMLRLKSIYHLKLMQEDGKYTHRGFKEYALSLGLEGDVYEELYWFYRMIRDKKDLVRVHLDLEDIKHFNGIVCTEAERMKVVLDVKKKKAS